MRPRRPRRRRLRRLLRHGAGVTGVAAQRAKPSWSTSPRPAATFIAYNYNTSVDVAAFEAEAKRILAEVEAECGWMYETWHV